MRKSGKMRLRWPPCLREVRPADGVYGRTDTRRLRLLLRGWLCFQIRRQAPSRNLALNFSQLIPLSRIQIIVLLQVEPKLGRVAEVLRQAKSRIGCNRTFPLYDRQNPIRGHMKLEAKRTRRQAEGPHKFLLQDLAR